jgi:hypothetical protein
MSTWASTGSSSGSSTSSAACSPRTTRPRSPFPPATGRGISISIRTASGSTRSRRKARPSRSSTTTPRRVASAARQTISTLPPGFAGSNFCSEVLVSSDGRFVYAGNRLHDSIGIFSIGADGTLAYVGEEWTRGNYPRSFSFDPSGRFLTCCNQRGDTVAVFRVDRRSGALAFTGHYAAVGNPSMLVFLDLA